MGYQINFDKIKQRKNIAFIAFLSMLAVLLYLPYFSAGISCDAGGYMFRANSILHGANLYVDYPTNKTPGLIYLLAFAFLLFGKSLFVARLLVLIFHIMNAIILFWIGKKLWDNKIGMLSGVFYLIGVSLPSMESHYVLMEPFMVFFSLLGVLFFFQYRENQKQNYLLFSGAAIGLSVLFKQPGVLTLLAIIFFYICGIWNRNNRTREYVKSSTKVSLLLIIGFAIPILLVVLHLWLTNALDVFLVHGQGKAGIFLSNPFNKWLYAIFASYSFVWVFAIVSFLTISYKFIRDKVVDKELFLVIWILFSLVTAITPIIPHRFVQAIPPACLLASIALTKIWTGSHIIRNSKREVDYKKIIAIMGIFLFISASVVSTNWWLNYEREEGMTLEQQKEVANYIKSHTTENEKIFAFPTCPEYYFLSDRDPPCRFIFFNSRSVGEVGMNYTIEQIKKENVAYIVVRGGAMVNNKSVVDQHFYDFILDHYEPEKTINKIDIYARKQGAFFTDE